MLVDSSGNTQFFGKLLDDKTFPESANRGLMESETYAGLDSITNEMFMNGYFTNKLHNTVGIPVERGGGHYGLFIRPDTKLRQIIIIWR
ncbi:hypothetical protein [Planococcus sp. ISL-110]|uniref:hypothetical protein n=1 Tax=Planococcus sp. ISL-110 TaxID=2819167 RepID=UPI001BEB5C25|nr:hypothetical protein [Planococcus sp. ISL-110]MBT2569590.1 hypothetical protein [Planococcus sp. ISL-110]